MAGRDSVCLTPSPCRRFYPDERYTPPTGDCGRHQAGASPASTWSCPRAHNRSLGLRISSPIGQSPAPNPPGRATIRSGRPPRNHPPCSGAADLLLRPSAALSRPLAPRPPLRARSPGRCWPTARCSTLDARLSRALVHPDRFSELLADLGNVQVAVPVLAVALAYVAWRAPPPGTAPLVAAARGGGPADGAGPGAGRPAEAAGPTAPAPRSCRPATGYYPSGHTATAAVAYGAATLLLLPWLTLPRRPPRTPRHLRRARPRGVVRAGPAGLPLAAGRAWPVGAWARCCCSLSGAGAQPK